MQSKEKESSLWLVCLLLFAVLLAAVLFLIPRRLMPHAEQPAPSEVTERPESGETADARSASVGNVVSGADADGVGSSILPSSDDTQPLSDASAGSVVSPVIGTPSGNTVTSDAIIPSADSSEGNAAVVISEASASTPALTPTPEAMHVHRYRSGVCEGCGKAVSFCSELLPDELCRESKKPGKLVTWDYVCPAYANHGYGEYEKSALIYLPYDYDESSPYNVLVLIPPSGGDENSWLKEEHAYGSGTLSGRTVLDRMFELGWCEPCIVVCPVAENDHVIGLTAGIYQMRDELRETILPYVATHYSTYAKDGQLESLRAARDHFALGGASNGALFTFEGGMRYNFDLFGSYIALSGDGEPWVTVSMIQEEQYASLPVNCLFTGAGTYNDWAQYYTKDGYNYFLEHDERFRAGENIWNVDVSGEHEWKVWLTGLANGMQVIF